MDLFSIKKNVFQYRLKNSMRCLIPSVVFLLTLPPAFAGDNPPQKSTPTFTNRDLEKYFDSPSPGTREFKRAEEEENHTPSSRDPVDAATLFNENNRSVVAVIAYNSEDVPITHGSGFILTRDGTVVTSHHVVSSAVSLKVRTGNVLLEVNGLLYEDRENDIAVIRAEGEDLPAVQLGDSDDIEINDTVYVMSSPDGVGNVITEGILNGIRAPQYRKRILQVTAPFSAGSSGGPVFNHFGEVIGIATFQVRDIKNLHFAMPINLIRDRVSNGGYSGLSYPLPGGYENPADMWLDRANRLRDSGRYSDAVDAYRKALEINGDRAAAYSGLGNTFLLLKNYKEAAVAFRQSIRLEPESAWAHSNLGLAYYQRGMHKEAVVALKKAISIMPDLAAAHYNLGLAYRSRRSYEEAVEAFIQAVKINPDHADAHYALGRTYLNIQEEGSAQKELDILKVLDPALADKLSLLMD